MSERLAQLLTTTIDLREALSGNVNLPLGDQPISARGAFGKIHIVCMNYGPEANLGSWQVGVFHDGAVVDTKLGIYLGSVVDYSRWPNILTHVFVFRRK